ncbi:MAG TPA: GIY-YIG nuclease family protein [Patescibacteria group bacterium]|nr:GIY-YIG nuclease family protein [Patescibacteria group bacterium]
MYCIYAIYNPKHNKFYIGQTKNLPERIRLHNNHVFPGYTSRFDGEWQLIYHEEVGTRQEALKREKQLKSYQGRQFIKKFIRE